MMKKQVIFGVILLAIFVIFLDSTQVGATRLLRTTFDSVRSCSSRCRRVRSLVLVLMVALTSPEARVRATDDPSREASSLIPMPKFGLCVEYFFIHFFVVYDKL